MKIKQQILAQAELINRLYQQGYRWEEISRRLGINVKTLQTAVYTMGLLEKRRDERTS